MDVRHEVIRRNAVTGIDDERRLVGGDPLDRHAGAGGLEREDPAGGHPPDERGPPGDRDHRLKVLALPLERVRLHVAAVAATTPVVIEHGEVRREQIGELDEPPPLSPAERAADQDHRRSLADTVERDLRAVPRLDHLHCVSSASKGCLLGSTPPESETHRPQGDSHRRFHAGGVVTAYRSTISATSDATVLQSTPASSLPSLTTTASCAGSMATICPYFPLARKGSPPRDPAVTHQPRP